MIPACPFYQSPQATPVFGADGRPVGSVRDANGEPIITCQTDIYNIPANVRGVRLTSGDALTTNLATWAGIAVLGLFVLFGKSK